MPIPNFSKSNGKLRIGILVIDSQGNIFMSSDRFQNLLNKFLTSLNSLRPSIAELRGQAEIPLS